MGRPCGYRTSQLWQSFDNFPPGDGEIWLFHKAMWKDEAIPSVVFLSTKIHLAWSLPKVPTLPKTGGAFCPPFFIVFFKTLQEFDGSDSGARPDEAVSWTWENKQPIQRQVGNGWLRLIFGWVDWLILVDFGWFFLQKNYTSACINTISSGWRLYFGSTPHPVTVTTRIVTF